VQEDRKSDVDSCVKEYLDGINGYTWIGLPDDNLTNPIARGRISFGRFYPEGRIIISIENATVHVPCASSDEHCGPSIYASGRHGIEFDPNSEKLQLENRTAEALQINGTEIRAAGYQIGYKSDRWTSHTIYLPGLYCQKHYGNCYITVTAINEPTLEEWHDVKYAVIGYQDGAHIPGCGIFPHCLIENGGLTSDYNERCGYLVAPNGTANNMAAMCQLLTRETSTNALPTLDARHKWGALEKSIVSALSTFATVATTAAAYLCYRLRKNAKNSEDGVRLAIAKP
jgi:hypothetical protein